MANTFSQIYLHIVFSTKNREKLIDPDIQDRVWAYIGGIAKRHGMTPIQIGGMEDHVHACVGILTTMSASQATKAIKGDSSKWIHQEFPSLRSFHGRMDMGSFRFRDRRYRMWSITSNASVSIMRADRSRMNIGLCCDCTIWISMSGICWGEIGNRR